MIDLLLINYNVPDAVDSLMQMKSRFPHRWIVVDNGSDEPHPMTSLRLEENRGGMWPAVLAGLEQVTAPFVWILTTSMRNIRSGTDPLAYMISYFIRDVVGVSPMWRGELTGPHLLHAKAGGTLYLNTASIWRTDWLKANLPDERLISGWGTDFELSLFARQQEKQMLILDGVTVQIQEHYGRNGDQVEKYTEAARKKMDDVFTEKYGGDWRRKLCGFLQ
jgi:hypothetical protein